MNIIESPTKSNSIFVVMAAFNEETVIANTINSVLPFIKNIIVVDDCSSDLTAAVAEQSGAEVVRHLINLGQGAALQTGIEYAKLRGAEYIVTFDADGQHSAEEMLPMLESLKTNKVDIVLGSRFMGNVKNLPKKRRLLLKLAIKFTQWTGGGTFTDVHNGFRVMSKPFFSHFKFHQNRMAHASEILKYITANRVSYVEFPTTITYSDYSIRKGQRNANAIQIVMELILGRVSR